MTHTLLSLLRLAARNLFRQRARTAVTLTAICFGVIGLILSGGFIQDIYVQLGESLIHSHLGHVQVFRTGYFERGAKRPTEFLLDDVPQLQGQIAQSASVKAVMPRVEFTALLSNGRTDYPVLIEGIHASKERSLSSFLRFTAGRALEDTDAYGAVLGAGIARTLKLNLGDQVTLMATTLEGAINTTEITIVGLFQSFSKDYDARAVKISIAAAQELLGTQGANSIAIELNETAMTASEVANIKGKLANRGVDVRAWYELSDFYAKTVDLYEAQFGVLRIIVLVMIILGVANAVTMTVFERLGEFGTMQAMGNTRRYVWGVVMTECTLLGILGAAIGVLIAIVVATVVSKIGIPMPPPPNSELGYVAQIRLVPAVIAEGAAVGIIGPILSSIYPAIRVARVPIVDALRTVI